MFISFGEIIIIAIIAFIALEPQDIVKIMKRVGHMIFFLKDKYTKLAKEITSWWNDRN
jgi:Sec-independent protein translocase protein TatA